MKSLALVFLFAGAAAAAPPLPRQPVQTMQSIQPMQPMQPMPSAQSVQPVNLRQTLQEYDRAEKAAPRQLTPSERAELRRQLAEQVQQPASRRH